MIVTHFTEQQYPLLFLGGMKPAEAINAALSYMEACTEEGHGGVIAIDNSGNIGMNFSTPRMSWASVKGGQFQYGINRRVTAAVLIRNML